MRAGVRKSQGRPLGQQLAAPCPLLGPRPDAASSPPATHRLPHSREEAGEMNEEEEQQGKGDID